MTNTTDSAPRWTPAFLLAAAVWATGMVGGFGIVSATSHLPTEIPAQSVPDDVAQAAHAAQVAKPGPAMRPKSDLGIFAFIFRRNLSVYIWLLAGLLSAGAITFVVLLANGILLGQTIGLASDAGVSPMVLGNLLLPHGMLEIGTFCIAGAVGFQGLGLACRWGSTDGWRAVKALRLGLVLVYGTGALAVAAGVETFITGALAAAIGTR